MSAAVFSASCRSLIIEDKLSCPGNLFVYFDKTSGNASASRDGITIAGYNENGTTDSKSGNFESNPDGLVLEVGVGMIDLFAYTGYDGVNVERNIAGLKDNSTEPGELFTYYRKVDFTTGFGSDYIKLMKQYAEFTVKLPSLSSDTTVFITGQNGSIDIASNKALGNSFSIQTSRSGEFYRCRILRQSSNDVRVDIKSSGKTIATIQLEDILKRIRYDWTKKDLDDISIIFDKNRNYISASLKGYIDNDYTKS